MSNTHTYKLTYGKGKGLGEIIRLVFAAGDVKYEDNRLTPEEFQEQKKNFPFKVAPVLTVDGKDYCQSTAIARYLATEFNLMGANNMEMLRIMEVEEVFKDMVSELFKVYFAQEGAAKEEVKQKCLSGFIPKLVEFVTTRLKENNGGKGWIVGDKLSYADLVVFNGYDQIQVVLTKDGILGDNALLKAHSERVANDPRIAKWLKERPVTEN